MSKKIAEGIDAPGARREDRQRRVHEDRGGRARAWPSRWSRSARRPGVRTEALITRDGRAARARGRQRARGHRVRRDARRGAGPTDLEALSVELAARMLVARRRRSRDPATADARVRARAGVGRRPREVPRRSSSSQGGDPRVVDDYARLPSAPRRRRRGGAARRVRDARSTPRRSAAPPCCSARAATGSTRPSIPASA